MAGQFKRIADIRKRREQSSERALRDTREARDARRKELEDAQARVREQEREFAAYWQTLMDGLGNGLDYAAFQAALVWRDMLQAQLEAAQRQLPQFAAALEKAEQRVARAADDLQQASRALRKIEEQWRREREADALVAEVLAEAEADEFVETLPCKSRH